MKRKLIYLVSGLQLYATICMGQSQLTVTYDTVTYDVAGGSSPTPEPIIRTKGAPIGEEGLPVIEHKLARFDGWYSDDPESLWTNTTPVTKSVTLHARWGVHIAFVGSGGGLWDVEWTYIGAEIRYLPSAEEREGYEFEGWFLDEELTQKFYYGIHSRVKGHMTLYARYRLTEDPPAPKQIQVTLYYTDPRNYQYEESFFQLEGVLDLKTPSDDYFIFGGWYLDPDFENKFDDTTSVSSHIKLYARWIHPDEGKQFSVVFINRMNDMPDIPTQTVGYGETAVEPEVTHNLTDFRFTGWYTSESGDVLFDFNTPIISNTILYGKWEVIIPVYHSVTFMTDLSDTPTIIKGVKSGEKLEEEEVLVKRDGYVFEGWYTISGEQWDFKQAVTSDMTLYARWHVGQATGIGRLDKRGAVDGVERYDLLGRRVQPNSNYKGIVIEKRGRDVVKKKKLSVEN